MTDQQWLPPQPPPAPDGWVDGRPPPPPVVAPPTAHDPYASAPSPAPYSPPAPQPPAPQAATPQPPAPAPYAPPPVQYGAPQSAQYAGPPPVQYGAPPPVQYGYGGYPAAAIHPPMPKDKTTAVLLAVFLGFWTWCYTYKKDAWKFWTNLGLTIVTIGFWALVAWIWAIVDVSVKDQNWYQGFPNVN